MTTSQSTASTPQAGAAPKRRRGRRVIFGLFTAGLIIALQEALFRALFPIPETTLFNRIRYQLMAESDPRFRPLMQRGLAYDTIEFESAPDGWKHPHRLNRFGFREKDFSIDPPAGKKRILVVGDSVTEGQGAAANETIAANLGRDLGPGYEVLNLGAVAATLDYVSQLACDAVTVLRPETLVVVMYANDLPAPPVLPKITGLRRMKENIDKDAAAARRLSWLPRAAVLVMRAVNGQPIYRRFGPTIHYFAPVPDSTNPFRAGEPPLPGLRPDLEAAMRAGRLNPWLLQQYSLIPGMLRSDMARTGSPEAHLRTIRLICGINNVRLAVAWVPFHGTLHPRYAQALKDLTMPAAVADTLATDPAWSAQAPQLKAACDLLGIPLIDTTAALKAKENAGEPQFWPYDSHPRPAGYATIAGAIAAGLKTD